MPPSLKGSSIEAVREPSVPSANALTGPIADPLVAEAAAEAERERLVEALGGQRGPHAEGERAVGREPLPGGEPAAALEVVDAGQPAPVGLAHALAHAPRRARPRPARARPPSVRTPRARAAARRARRSPRSRRSCGGRASRRRTGRPPQARLELVGLERRRELVAQRVREHPAVAGAGRAKRARTRRRALVAAERSVCSRASAHSRKCTCASWKPGVTQRPARSTRSDETADRSPSRTSTPPAMRAPATAIARARGKRGSPVSTVPPSRITAEG